MTLDERLENISQQLKMLTSMQLTNERRFQFIADTFVQNYTTATSY
jgi:hypothetical protein